MTLNGLKKSETLEWTMENPKRTKKDQTWSVLVWSGPSLSVPADLDHSTPNMACFIVWIFKVREGVLSAGKFLFEPRGQRHLWVGERVLSFDKFHNEHQG